MKSSEKFKVLRAYIKQIWDIFYINNLMIHLKALQKQEQYPPK